MEPTISVTKPSILPREKAISIVSIETQAYIWMGIPAILFLFGWFRLWIALPIAAGIAWAAYRDICVSTGSGSSESAVAANKTWKWSVALILPLLVLMGMGGLWPQSYDYWYRNAVFYDLAMNTWPVEYAANADGTPRMLCYYFAWWLPSALVSKATGYIMPGDMAQILWAWWGLAIAFSWMAMNVGGKCKWWLLPVMLLFGFLDRPVVSFFSDTIISLLGLPHKLFIDAFFMSMPLHEHIEFIFNQALACWVMLPLIWRRGNSASALLLPFALLFVQAPLPCIGISTSMAYLLWKGRKTAFSASNLAALALIAVTGLFFLNNSNGNSPSISTFGIWNKVLILGISFYVISIGVWIPFIWKSVKDNPVFWIMAVTCFPLPFFWLGISEDLGIRALIPLMIFITFAAIRQLNEIKTLRSIRNVLMVMLTALGMLCWSEHYYTKKELHQWIKTPTTYSPKKVILMGNLSNPEMNNCYRNFIAEGDSFYRRYMMRRKD